MEIKIKSPAKINLALDIKGKRDDGYHNVEMVMQSVNLYDVITITSADHKDIKINFNKDLNIDIKRNTAYHAAKLFFEHAGIENDGINIYIEKNIPISAGLAGGSSDAAGVLVGLNNLFNKDYSKTELAGIGSKIGADVPFCIYGGTMLATGTGTELKKLNASPNCYFVLTKPDLSISTEEAYKLSDNTTFNNYGSVGSVVDALNSKNIEKLSKSVFNRFSQIIAVDELYDIEKIAYKSGSLASCMSGSGPTVFSMFTDLNLANECIMNLNKKYRDVFLCLPVGSGCEIVNQ